MNNKTATVRKRGFFDSSDAPEETVWQQAPLDYFSKLSKRLEDSFYIKEDESSNQWGNCILFLAGPYLVCKYKKHGNSLKYVKLDDGFYKIDVIKVNKKKGEKKSLVGFAITKNGCRAEYLSKKSSVFLKWRNELIKYCIMTDLEDNYRTMNVIGSGGYGKVFLLEEVLTKTKWAGKFIKINPQKSREKQLAMIRNEILALRKLDHPNIVNLREIYELDDEVCLVMEYIAGKRLFDEIVKAKGIPERDTALIIKQLFSILNYLEFKDIIHRDIKPENIIVSRGAEDEINLKLIDFGLATFHSKRDIIKRGGTAGYVAPEVLNNEFYDFKADLYSAGVIIYTCLTGKPLFYALNYNELLEKNKKGVLKFGGKSWNKISHKARDLLQNILEPNPSKRITLNKALNHPWLAAELTSQERGEMLDNTTKFGQMEVPKEKSISKVPGSLEMIPQFNKAPTNPEIQTHSNSGNSGNSASSATWFTSRFAMESGAYILNSFYKGVSKDSSEKDKSCNDLDAMNNDPKANVLTLPKQKALAQQRSLPAPSLTSLNPDNGQFHYEAGYNIKIHTINSFTELDAANDEEENPCSQKYSQLPNQDMFFGRPNFYEPNHEHTPQKDNRANLAVVRMKNNQAGKAAYKNQI